MNGPDIPGIDGGKVTSLAGLAIHLDALLTLNRRPGITAGLAYQASAWKVAEEAGELAGAHSRWRGTSRRLGSLREVAGEAADVILAAAVYAIQAGVSPSVIDQATQPGPGFTAAAADAELCELTVAVGDLIAAHLQDGDVSACAATVITYAGSYAASAGIDPHTAVTAKARVILARGWREESRETRVPATDDGQERGGPWWVT